MNNGTMMQYFHWYTPSDGNFWKELNTNAGEIAQAGITAIWLPPAFKASAGNHSVGYDVYDLYDLGEFDQKSTTRTKYGTKGEYVEAVKSLKEAGISVYVDIVLNHLAGGDEKELLKAIKVNPENRNEQVAEVYDIEAFTKFTYSGRKNKYSEFEWNHTCFSGVDYDALKNETGIYSIINDHGSDWEEMIDDEKGNYDYLMFNDIEFRNEAVRNELKIWGEWYFKTLNFDGVRLDAVKHISPKFYNEWLYHMRQTTKNDLFAVGEYWAPGLLPLLIKYIEATEESMSLFDSALHHKFHQASESGNQFDLSTIFEDTLVGARPDLAITLVANHDTQPLQALEAPVQPWFKPLAYGLILLREQGYPCIFYPDMYGAQYTDKGKDGNDYEIFMPVIEELKPLMKLRQTNANGNQIDYFDHPNCIGFTRLGDIEKKQTGCAVILSNGDEGFKEMNMGKIYINTNFKDALSKRSELIKTDANGKAVFSCNPGSISVWVPA